MVLCGFRDWRFAASALLYVGATFLFYRVSAADGLSYVIVPGLAAFLAVAAVAWHLKLLGSPARPECFVLHIALGIALLFMLNAVFSAGRPEHVPSPGGDAAMWLGALGDLYKWLAAAVWGVIASLIVATVGNMFVLGGLLFAVLLPNKLTAAGILIVFFIAGLIGFAQIGPLARVYFAGGFFMTVAALRLQHDDAYSRDQWLRVRRRMADSRGYVASGVAQDIKIDVIKALLDRGTLTGDGVRGILASRLCCDPVDPRIGPVSEALLRQMVVADRLLVREYGAGVDMVRLTPGVVVDDNFILGQLVPILRVIMMGALALLYVASPVDFIPDFIPVLGVLDDTAISVFAAVCAYRNIVPVSRER